MNVLRGSAMGRVPLFLAAFSLASLSAYGGRESSINSGGGGNAPSPSSSPTFIQALLQAYVKSPNPSPATVPGEGFAVSAVHGDTLIVGAPNESYCGKGINPALSDTVCLNAGAVYVFTRLDGLWSEQAYLKASNTDFGHLFGTSVALSGETLAVGAPGERSCATGINGNQADSNCLHAGAIYIFTRTAGVWTQQAYVKPSRTRRYPFPQGPGLGSSVALDGETLVAGSITESSCARGINGDQSNLACSNAGAVYVFTRTGTTWAQQAYVKASNANAGDSFGTSVAVDGNTIAVGSAEEDSCAVGLNGNEDDNGCSNAGATYLFTRMGNAWSQQAYVKASTTEPTDGFGTSVALDNGTLAVSASREKRCGKGVNVVSADASCFVSGAAYVFAFADGRWSQEAYLKASNARAGDVFGFTLALQGDLLAVGARNQPSCVTGARRTTTDTGCAGAGAAYVFSRTAGVWREQSQIKASNTDPADAFGTSVALDGTTLTVGASGEKSCARGINGNQADNSCAFSGAVYVYADQRGN